MSRRKKNLLPLILIIIIFVAACVLFSDPLMAQFSGLFGDSAVNTTASSSASGDLKITVLNTGNSDCTVIQTPGGHTVMIDAGESDDFELISSFLRENGISTLHTVIATHPHADHIGSMTDILNHFEVENFYMTKARHSSKLYKEMLETLGAHSEIEVHTPKIGSGFTLDGVSFVFLGPVAEYSELNDTSIVTYISYGQNSFLFAGDVEKSAEEDMVGLFGSKLKANVLKVPHHGSKGSSTKDFLKMVSPQYAIITADQANDYGHPSDKTLQRLEDVGAAIYRTDQNGNISIVSDGTTITVTPQNP